MVYRSHSMIYFLILRGGIRINEPAADLAVAAALISALSNEALPVDTVFFGEIGLAGEVRQVSQPDVRLKESSKLGFERATIPKLNKKIDAKNSAILTNEISHIKELSKLLGGSESEPF